MSQKFIKLEIAGGATVCDGDRAEFIGTENGVFARWNFDGETLLAENDFSGCCALFYAVAENRIWVSGSIVKLLVTGAPANLDFAALAVFLRLGNFVGADTAFSEIRALAPGARLTWKLGKQTVSGGDYHAPTPAVITREAAVREYAARFRRALRKRIVARERAALPLSGGRDSRFILFELHRAKAAPECVTLEHFAPRPNEDVRIAQQLCRELNVEHRILPQPNRILKPELEKNLSTHFCSDEHVWYLPLAEYLDNRFDSVYDGLAGDTLCGEVSYSEANLKKLAASFERGDWRLIAEMLLDEGYLPKLLQPDLLQKMNRRSAVERLCVELEKHRGAANKLLSFQFYNRTRREVALAPFGILNNRAAVIAPFLDTDFFDFAMAVPMRINLRQKMRENAINHLFPEFARIEYENKDAPETGDPQFFRRCNRELLAYADSRRKSEFVSRRFWLPRLTRGLLDQKYSRSSYSFGVQLIYLLQLERLLQTQAA